MKTLVVTYSDLYNKAVCSHFVLSVTAEVRGLELHMAKYSESIDTITTFSCILLGDRVHTCVIWKKIILT